MPGDWRKGKATVSEEGELERETLVLSDELQKVKTFSGRLAYVTKMVKNKGNALQCIKRWGSTVA